MKKKLSICLVIFFISSFCFAIGKLFNFGVGLSSRFPIYDSGDLNKVTEHFLLDEGYRIIIGTDTRIELNVIKQLSFFADANMLMDFNFSGDEYFNIMDLSFSSGVKVYPGIGGLACGIGYSLGTRFDFYSLLSSTNEKLFASTDYTVKKNDWGNGFKLFLEYDFSYNSKYKYLPTLGINWRFMPRGNNFYDNVITLYCMVRF